LPVVVAYALLVALVPSALAEEPEIVSFPTSDGGVVYADIYGTGEHAVVRYMREQGANTLSVVGASFGGWATALAVVEVEPGEIDGIVLLAASAIGEPEKMKGRKLFITSRDDTSGTGKKRLPSIRDQYERARAERVRDSRRVGARAVRLRNRAGRAPDVRDPALPECRPARS
jgi:pimeloyl-ACP methyl ester carboxylesterase